MPVCTCVIFVLIKSEQVEEKLHLSPRNQELIELELEKSLVYFTTSLRS